MIYIYILNYNYICLCRYSFPTAAERPERATDPKLLEVIRELQATTTPWQHPSQWIR
jgi:hypothetical protein